MLGIPTAARGGMIPSVCCRCRFASQLNRKPLSRTFSHSTRVAAEDDANTSSTSSTSSTAPVPVSSDTKTKSSGLSGLFPSRQPKVAEPTQSTDGVGSLQSLSQIFGSELRKKAAARSQASADLDYDASALNPTNFRNADLQPPHHLHVYATKHNTHITLTKPNRDAIISVAAGNIGFRKSGRGSYDAAYQLSAYVMNQIQEQGLLTEIRKLELVLRGYGAGREAVTKTLLGAEGRNIRNKVVRVTDSTRLKFGGTRSKKPRRL